MTDQVKNLIVDLDPDTIKCYECKSVIEIKIDPYVQMGNGKGCLCLECYEKVYMGPRILNPTPTAKYKVIQNVPSE